MQKIFWLALLAAAGFSGCDASPGGVWTLRMPEFPPVYGEILGPAKWHIEWVGADGFISSAETEQNSYSASLLEGFATAIIAYPYLGDVPKGIVKPCGAIYPLDIEGGEIKLSWKGGVDAFFYFELAKHSNPKRLPQNFNWINFRLLWTEAKLPEAILSDPWAADWELIAEKTSLAGFRSSLIAVKPSKKLSVTVPEDGPWVGSSPLAGELDWEKGKTIDIGVDNGTSYYFCPGGILKCIDSAWVFRGK